MFDNFSFRTRGFIKSAIRGEEIRIGGSTVGPFSADQISLLERIAANVVELGAKRGSDLVAFFETEATDAEEVAAPEEPKNVEPAVLRRWKLSRILAHSFRGIGPAAVTWELDFAGRPHLLHGPNGSGKSSILGAVCWCLTGHLLRDDGPPGPPEDVPTYSAGKKPKALPPRPDALTLLHADGTPSDIGEPFWVAVEIVDDSEAHGGSTWVRRNSRDGLAISSDGESWTAVASLDDAGISELDAELHFLLPARAAHLRFGKDSRPLSLFSQLVGLNELEEIAEIASRAHAALTKDANAIEKKDLPAHGDSIVASLERLNGLSSELLKTLPSYAAVQLASRTHIDAKAFTDDITGLISQNKKQLAADLAIELPAEVDPNRLAVERQLDLLPGHLDTATRCLQQDVSRLFGSTLGRKQVNDGSLASVVANLSTFVTNAKRQIEERLRWARREHEMDKARLMLAAAEHFEIEADTCPVCEQALTAADNVRAILHEMKPFATQPHLKKTIDDLELGLISELNAIVPPVERSDAAKSLGMRLQQDWKSLVESGFDGLARSVVRRFDAAIAELANGLPAPATNDDGGLSAGYEADFPGAFAQVEQAISEAERSVALERQLNERRADVETTLRSLLIYGPYTLATRLERGASTNQSIKVLSQARDVAMKIHSLEVERDKLLGRLRRLRAMADAAAATKDLDKHVRNEIIALVKAVELPMKQMYGRLYEDSHLSLDLITTGHAANPAVQGEFNIYLRTGDALVPAGAYANAGRLRALAICFAFALLGKSSGALKVLLLDDPALSLDDEHRARLLDHLIAPMLQNGTQVILATHYETFYKSAELLFASHCKLQLVPRRKQDESICFEPGDLLARLNQALAVSSCSWREMAINLRRWVERMLSAISSFCPEPFLVFNNIPGSVDGYERITDKRVATSRRAKIIGALRSPPFMRVMHRVAHDEEPVEAEVRDALAVVTVCRDDCDTEIARFRQLYQHATMSRSIGANIGIINLEASLPDAEIAIVGRAAAASFGIGMIWEEHGSISFVGVPVAIAKSNVLAPIARLGNLLLLDPNGDGAKDGDLVVAETAGGNRYLRRYWKAANFVNLEAVNPVEPLGPILVDFLGLRVRRVIGVLYDGFTCKPSGHDNEWATCTDVPKSKTVDLRAIRVDGTCLEPVARDGQLVLVHNVDHRLSQPKGELMFVDVVDRGAYVKRVYRQGDRWILCSVNPVVDEEPMLIAPDEINRACNVVGVLFEGDESSDP
jgi:SOS-response transcriptional repressor LexA